MKKQAVRTDRAPAAIGPYEQAIRVGDFLFTSGQIALDPASGKMLHGEIEHETEQTLRNVEVSPAGGDGPGLAAFEFKIVPQPAEPVEHSSHVQRVVPFFEQRDIGPELYLRKVDFRIHDPVSLRRSRSPVVVFEHMP